MGRGGILHVLHHVRTSSQGLVARSLRYASGSERGFVVARLNVSPSFSSDSLLSSCFVFSPQSFRFISTSTVAHRSSNTTETVSRFSSASNQKSQDPDFSHLPGARLPKSNSIGRPPTRKLEIDSKQAKDAFKHCFESVRKRDVDAYLSILSMPKVVQPELFAIHAFNVELALIREKVTAHSGRPSDTTGIYRLQFWKDALNAIYGQSAMPIPRQPVAVALCAFADRANSELLQELVSARQQTIGDKPFATIHKLSAYGGQTTGALIQLTCSALSRSSKLSQVSENVDRAAIRMGAAYGITNLVRATLPLLQRGVVLLPSDLLSIHGLTPDKVYNKKQPDDVKALVKDLIQSARVHLNAARDARQSVPRPLRQAFASTAISTQHMINTIEKHNYDLYSPHLQRRDPLLLWRLLYCRLMGSY